MIRSMPSALAIVLAQVSSSELRLEHIPTPASSPSRLPNLWTDPDGRISLSWVEWVEDESAEESDESEGLATLKLARLDENGWSATHDVASGRDWFVNWADFPSVVSLDSEHMLAHFLEKTAAGPYDYQVQIVRSADGGKSWSTPARLHTDTGRGEHGFVSLAPLGASTAAAVWLDGRNIGQEGEALGHGAMCLYARTVDSSGALGAESLVDERVCDCCQTAAVRAPDGALVIAYRDRSAEEVRDISVVRLEEGRVQPAAWSSRDGWEIAGCPVNGPALDVAGEWIGMAWFTLGSDVKSRVLCAFSKDGGRTFSPPLALAGEHALGRVDVVFDSRGRLVVSWLEVEGDDAAWRVARIVQESGLLDVHTVVPTRSGRESGLARLGRDQEGVLFAWTELKSGPHVALCRLRWAE